MKLKSLFCIFPFFLSSFLVYASTDFDPKAFQVRVSGGPAVSWDFTGYGAGVELQYTVHHKHSFGIEYLYLDMNAKSRTYNRRTPRGLFVGNRTENYKTNLDEHFLFFNYRYTDVLPLKSTKRISYYYGLGGGIRYLLAETDTNTHVVVTGRSGRTLMDCYITSHNKEHDTCAAGQVFAGLGFDLNDHITLSLGGRGIFSKAYQPTTAGVINPVRSGNLNIKSSSFTGMIEASVTIRW